MGMARITIAEGKKLGLLEPEQNDVESELQVNEDQTSIRQLIQLFHDLEISGFKIEGIVELRCGKLSIAASFKQIPFWRSIIRRYFRI